MAIFNFFKKKNTIVENRPELLEQVDVKNFDNPEVLIKHDVDGAEIWLVHWKARRGSYYGDWKPVCKAFFNKEDAQKFVNCLKEAQKVLQYTENIDIHIEKAE